MGGLGFEPNVQQLMQFVPRIMVLLLCLPVHEFAHGYMAYKLGDKTAANLGRLTLNPFAHLDIFGSLLLLFAGFGWAKPVPVQPRAFSNPRRGMALVAAAGPLANIIMATLVMVFLRIISPQVTFHPAVFPRIVAFGWHDVILQSIISINLILAVFNMLPVPPLDGSRILYAFLPDRLYFGAMRYERFIMIGVMLLVFMGALTGIILALSAQLYRLVVFITQPVSMIMGG